MITSEVISIYGTELAVSGSRFTKYWMFLALFPDIYTINGNWYFNIFFRFGFIIGLLPNFFTYFWLFDNPSAIIFIGGSSADRISHFIMFIAIIMLLIASFNYYFGPLAMEKGLRPFLWVIVGLIALVALLPIIQSGSYFSLTLWLFLIGLAYAVYRPLPHIALASNLSNPLSVPKWRRPRFSFEIPEQNPNIAFETVLNAAYNAKVEGYRTSKTILTSSPPDYFYYTTERISGRKGSTRAPATKGVVMLGQGPQGTLVTGTAGRIFIEDKAELLIMLVVMSPFLLVALAEPAIGIPIIGALILLPKWFVTRTSGNRNIGRSLRRNLRGINYRER